MKIQFKNLITPLTKEEFNELEKSILKEGCRDALIVWNDILLDGHNRLTICKKHSIKFSVKEIKLNDKIEAEEWIIKNQFARRNLSDIDRMDLAEKLREIISKKAKEKQKKSGGAVRTKSSEPSIKTDTEIAKIAGVGETKLKQYRTIKDTITKEQKEEIRKGDLTVNKVVQDIKEKEFEKEVNRQKKDIKSGKIKLPAGKFEAIVFDPPWRYEGKYDAEGRRVANPYPDMSLHEIENIILPTADNCILWFWTTHKFIFNAKMIMDKWGFDYKGILVWDKEKIGMGSWLRMECEFCLLGIQGKPIWIEKNIRDIIREPRREHSRKPEAFYKLVEKTTIGRKLDYFSREKRKGWETFGVDKFNE